MCFYRKMKFLINKNYKCINISVCYLKNMKMTFVLTKWTKLYEANKLKTQT